MALKMKMTAKSGLLAGAWALSCGAAYMLGSSGTAISTENPEVESNSTNRSSRVVTSPSGNPANGFGSRENSSRSVGGASSGNRSEIELTVLDLLGMNDPIARTEGMLELVRNLSPEEFLEVVEVYRGQGVDSEQFGEYKILLTAWAQVAPLEALDYAKENTGTPLARQTILAAWAKNDTQGAIDWARDNFDAGENNDRANPWLVGVIEGIVGRDQGLATNLLEEMPFSRERGEALDAIYSEVLKSGTDDAKVWISSLTDPRLQAGAAARLAGQLADDDPIAAAEWAGSLGPETMQRAAQPIIDRWAKQDLGSATNWVDQQPEEIAAAAAPALINQMIDQADLGAASDWLANYEGNPAFDDSVRSLVYNAMGDAPDLGADWIMRLTNDRDKERTFHRVLNGWMRKDRESAMNYINNNEVPESIKRRAGMTPEEG